MSLFRQRLSCFYCGQSSNLTWAPGVGSFHCNKCDSTNYLDSKGEITDPPTRKTSSNQSTKRYGRPLGATRSPSPLPSQQTASPFCHTCTSNQQFITQALAEYLPAPTDPKYKEYERDYPKYKQKLEERYPPVCINCEPAVRAQLQQAGYVAKSDYVKKMLDKTRSQGIPKGGSPTRRIMGIVGGAMYLLALAVQLVWNLFGVTSIPEDGLRDDDGATTFGGCVKQTSLSLECERGCVEKIVPLLPWALLLNVASVWWNPILLRATRRAQGLGEFYKLQLLLVVIRTVSWKYVTREEVLEEAMIKAAHAILLMLNIVVSVVALRTARPKAKVVIDFNQDVPLLAPTSSKSGPPPSASLFTPPVSESSQSSSANPLPGTRLSFPVNRLAPRQPADTYRPPTPPLDGEHDPDAMDVDTTVPASQNSSFYRNPSPPRRLTRSAISSSFRAPQLPPAPLRQSPPQKVKGGGARSMSGGRKRNFLDWMSEATADIEDDDALTVMDDDDEYPINYDKAFIPASARSRKDYNFADPKLMIEEEETGLEGMFKDILNGLRDDPREAVHGQAHVRSSSQPGLMRGSMTSSKVGSSQQAQRSLRSHTPLGLPVPVLAALIFIVFLIAASSLRLAPTLQGQIELALTVWVASTGSLRLLDALRPSREFFEMSNILAYVVEGALSFCVLFSCLGRSQGLEQVEATATGPLDPAVGPEIELLDGMEAHAGAIRGAMARDDTVLDIAGMQPLLYGLVGWTILQEVMIALQERQRRLRA